MDCYTTVLSEVGSAKKPAAQTAQCWTCKRENRAGRAPTACAGGGSGIFTSKPQCSAFKGSAFSTCKAYKVSCPALVEVATEAADDARVKEEEEEQESPGQGSLGAALLDMDVESDEAEGLGGKCCLYTGTKKFGWASGACGASAIHASSFGEASCKKLAGMNICQELGAKDAMDCYTTVLSEVGSAKKPAAQTAQCWTCKRENRAGRAPTACAGGGSGIFTSKPQCSAFKGSAFSTCKAYKVSCPALVEVA